MTIRSCVPPPGANWTEWYILRDAEVREDKLQDLRVRRVQSAEDPYEECPVCDQRMYGPDDFL